MVANNQFDTIYHEHLRYYTVTFLKEMFKANGFEIFRVDRTPTHGGSIRVWACKNGQHQIESSVQDFLSLELKEQISNIKNRKF